MQDQKRQTIMLVDDNMANLSLAKNMLKDNYEVYALLSAERLFTFLEHVTPDLILLDIAMPVMNGYEAIKILKANEKTKNIPVVFVTFESGENEELEGLKLGAADYITKPFAEAILLKRIENQLLIQGQKAELKSLNNNLMEMVNEKSAQIVNLHNSIISSVADLVEFRDSVTGGHIMRTQEYVELLLNQLIADSLYSDEMVSWENMDNLLLSVQLHDLGKISISDTILNKPGKLTPEEFEIMKEHAGNGVKIIERIEKTGVDHSFLRQAKLIAGTHHEKWDGSGYPGGLKGKDIPLEGRIMAIADVYDALISVRPYKKAFSAEESAKIIVQDSGSHFDPVLVDTFKKLEGQFASVAEKYNDEAIILEKK